jgi:hypothetical protein
LVTVIDFPLRSVTVPRARLTDPLAGVAPGEGHTAPRPRPPVSAVPPVLVRDPVVEELALALFCPTL